MGIGRHGQILERQDGKIRMTVRPKATVLEDTDLAMIMGYIVNICDRFDGELISRKRAKELLHNWQYNCGTITPITKKRVMSYCDNHYLGQYLSGSDLFEKFDANDEAHQVLLEKIHEVFPSFVVKETQEVIA